MTYWPPDPTHEQIDAAVAELKTLVLQFYPDARSRVESGVDDPKAIHVVAIMDFEDTFDVLDHVSDRVMEIQINDGVPNFVIPLRPNDRTLAMMAEALPLVEDLA